MSVELTTRYLGLELRSPVVASAGPLTGRPDTLQALADAGVGAVVLPSLFEEEIVDAAFREHSIHTQGTGVFSEAFSYLPELPPAPDPVERYVQLVERAVGLLDVPVIASLNGTTSGGWVQHAAEIVSTGAAALELNVYLVAADEDETSAEVEARLLELVGEVRGSVDVPVAVKLSPFFTALGSLARQLDRAGADGLVLFNRFYQPDFDLETLEVVPSLDLSTPTSLRLPLRWIGILHQRVSCSLALSGGVHTPDAVVKGLLAGADVVMATASLLKHGPGHVRTLLDGVTAWLDEHDYESVTQLRGAMSQRSVPDPDAYERANYLLTLRRATGRYTRSPVARW
jgi:dihydroorotate dehydrogenase (fumarate)